jgi:hypothetical protein
MFHAESLSWTHIRTERKGKTIDAGPNQVCGCPKGEFNCDSEICYLGNSDNFATERRLRHLKNDKIKCNAWGTLWIWRSLEVGRLIWNSEKRVLGASFVTDDFQTTSTIWRLVLCFKTSKAIFYYRAFTALFHFSVFWKTVRVIDLNRLIFTYFANFRCNVIILPSQIKTNWHKKWIFILRTLMYTL